MICSFCVKAVFESGKTWGFHHQSQASLEESLRKRCPLCLKLGGDPDVSRDPKSFPMYRWTLRRAAKAREIQEAVILTFRPTRYPSSATDQVFYLLGEDGKTALLMHKRKMVETY